MTSSLLGIWLHVQVHIPEHYITLYLHDLAPTSLSNSSPLKPSFHLLQSTWQMSHPFTKPQSSAQAVSSTWNSTSPLSLYLYPLTKVYHAKMPSQSSKLGQVPLLHLYSHCILYSHCNTSLSIGIVLSASLTLLQVVGSECVCIGHHCISSTQNGCRMDVQ